MWKCVEMCDVCVGRGNCEGCGVRCVRRGKVCEGGCGYLLGVDCVSIKLLEISRMGAYFLLL